MYSLIGLQRKVIQITDEPFVVAKPLFWVECDENVMVGMYYSQSGKFEPFNSYIDMELEQAKSDRIFELYNSIKYEFENEPISIIQLFLTQQILLSGEKYAYIRLNNGLRRYTQEEFNNKYNAFLKNVNVQMTNLYDEQEKIIKNAKSTRELIK